jgi:hypothetical protein
LATDAIFSRSEFFALISAVVGTFLRHLSRAPGGGPDPIARGADRVIASTPIEGRKSVANRTVRDGGKICI